MNMIWKEIQISVGNITKKENAVVLVLIAVYTWIFVNPLKNAAMAMGTRVAPYMYLFMMNDHVVHLTMLSVFLLFLAVTLDDSSSLILRMGKWGYRTATIGYLVFVLITVLFFQLTVIIISSVIMMPVLTFDSEWGEGWRLLTVQTNLSQFSPMFYPSAFLVGEYSAQDATVKTILFETTFLLSLTLMTFVFITCVNKVVAFVWDIAVVLSDLLFYNLYPIPFRKFSLVSLCMLDTYQKPEIASGITEQYGMIVLAAILLLALFAYFVSNYLLFLNASREKKNNF